MKSLSRRTFLKSTALAGASLATSRVLGANNDIRVAIIGLGNKGGSHVKAFKSMRGCRVTALCDVDPKRLAEKLDSFDDRKGIFTTTDLRRVIDRKDVDVVVIATCNHWHGPAAVWSCQAGKDVYVEKPVSHSLREGSVMVAAAKKYNRIVQAGTQYRSDPGLRAASEYISEGKIGRMLWGHVLWYERRGSIGRKAPWKPDWLDYDLYCGPAPLEPLTRDKLHYDWHWVWSTGDGDLANSGIHAFDVCRMLAGYDHLPTRSFCVGDRFAVDDAGQTPNTQLTVLDYKPAPIIIENRNLPTRKGQRSMDQIKGVREGIIFQCEHGYFAGFRGGGWIFDNDGKKIKQFKGDGGRDHHANFIEAVRRRKSEVLNAPIRQGHISSAVCHLGNLSFRLGADASRKEILEKIGDLKLARETFERIEKHLAANEVDLSKTPMKLGPWLTIDRQSDTISHCDGKKAGPTVIKAHELARGSYRKPFALGKSI
ncbi:MAG: Gfo/Idh/MocA family oxidoreductase [candidate division Zixibacteria bacterium]